MLGPDQVGRVEEIELDEWVGWFRGRWTPTRRFGEVEALFASEQALARGQYDVERWRASWEQIWNRGVNLAFPDGGRLERDFVC
jgi:hypothetical protein